MAAIAPEVITMLAKKYCWTVNMGVSPAGNEAARRNLACAEAVVRDVLAAYDHTADLGTLETIIAAHRLELGDRVNAAWDIAEREAKVTAGQQREARALALVRAIRLAMDDAEAVDLVLASWERAYRQH